jgi:hypothetical protein
VQNSFGRVVWARPVFGDCPLWNADEVATRPPRAAHDAWRCGLDAEALLERASLSAARRAASILKVSF